MLTSKQRAHLAGLATRLDPVVFLGKAGAATGVTEALDRALADHELVKLRFIDFKGPKKRTIGRVPLVAYVSRRASAEKIASREFSSAHTTARPPGFVRIWSPICRAGEASSLPCAP